MIVVVFRVRLKANVDEHSLIRANERMSELAKAMPGLRLLQEFHCGRWRCGCHPETA
jgi:hypothetical protein